MKTFFVLVLGYCLGYWHASYIYGCENCDQVRRWAKNERYHISCEIYNLPEESPDWFFKKGQESALDKVIEKLNKEYFYDPFINS